MLDGEWTRTRGEPHPIRFEKEETSSTKNQSEIGLGSGIFAVYEWQNRTARLTGFARNSAKLQCERVLAAVNAEEVQSR